MFLSKKNELDWPNWRKNRKNKWIMKNLKDFFYGQDFTGFTGFYLQFQKY